VVSAGVPTPSAIAPAIVTPTAGASRTPTPRVP
jgi:hypothetical protein